MENLVKISASIVVYNEHAATLQRAIESYLAIKVDKELIIIDNSPKNNLQEICEKYAGVRYIFTGQNIGFGKGHNLAISHFSKHSTLHMIINPDVYFDGVSMLQFLRWMESRHDISLAIPKVLNPDGTAQNIVRNIPTPLSLIKRRLHLNYDEFDMKTEEINDIPFAHGCFMVFRTDVLKRLGGFDERFFMYMEDVDIFIRAKEYGKTVINPAYEIYHEYRKGSSKNLKLLGWHLSSAIKFFMKYKRYKNVKICS